MSFCLRWFSTTDNETGDPFRRRTGRSQRSDAEHPDFTGCAYKYAMIDGLLRLRASATYASSNESAPHGAKWLIRAIF